MSSIDKIFNVFYAILLLSIISIRVSSQSLNEIDSIRVIFTQHMKDSTIIQEIWPLSIDYDSLGVISYNKAISIAAKRDSFVVNHLYKVKLTKYLNNKMIWMFHAQDYSQSRFIGLSFLRLCFIKNLWRNYTRPLVGITRYLWIRGNGKKAGKIEWYRKERELIYSIQI